jgi:hypothetical protein
MTVYINLDTMEYPRFDGDVALDPSANWSQIVEVNPPATLEDEMAYNVSPELLDGTYYQVWAIRKLSPEELEPIKPHEA